MVIVRQQTFWVNLPPARITQVSITIFLQQIHNVSSVIGGWLKHPPNPGINWNCLMSLMSFLSYQVSKIYFPSTTINDSLGLYTYSFEALKLRRSDAFLK